MKKFKSKIDWWVYIVVLFFTILAFLTVSQSLVVGILFIGIDILIIYLMLTTNYTLTKTYLHINAGFIYNMKIPYTDIISFAESNDPQSSPALSLDRIEINYANKDFGAILISPREKKQFLALLSEYWRE